LIFPFLFAVEELYSTWYQSGSFSLFNAGSGFYCLSSFFLFFFLLFFFFTFGSSKPNQFLHVRKPNLVNLKQGKEVDNSVQKWLLIVL